MASCSSFLPLIPFEIPIHRQHKFPKFIDNTNPPNSLPKFLALNSLHSSPFPTLESPIFRDPIPWLPGETLEMIFRDIPLFDDLLNSRESTDVARKKYNVLRRRQVRAETEAWEKAAEEYKELERMMLEKKLAPNLPYVKSLFLGWFEPLRNAIAKDLKVEKGKRHKAAYAHHLSLLDADKLAVIVMHKMMGLLMMGQEEGCMRVVQAAIHIGEAVEQEVFDLYFSFKMQFENEKFPASGVVRSEMCKDKPPKGYALRIVKRKRKNHKI